MYFTTPTINFIARRNLQVGFIGLGQMGKPMARNLVKNGIDVMVYDVDQQASVGFSRVGKSVQEIAKNNQMIFTMLPNNKIVKDVYRGPNGLLANAKRGTLLIDCSTIEFDVAQELCEDAALQNLNMIDAPVSGGVLGAESANLTFMVGGEDDLIKTASPLLDKMGKNIFHCGKNGSGQIAKMCNNMLLGITMIGLSEALALGSRLGLSPEITTNVINASSGRCWSSEVYNPVPGICANAPPSRNYQGGFSNSLISKDLKLSQDAAKKVNFLTTLGSKASEIYSELALNPEYAKRDFAIVYQKFLKGGETK